MLNVYKHILFLTARGLGIIGILSLGGLANWSGAPALGEATIKAADISEGTIAPSGPARFAISRIDPAIPQAGQNTGRYTSLAFNSSGNPLISYYDAVRQDLRLAALASTNGNCGPEDGWNCQTVDASGDVGKYSSIAAHNGGLLGNLIGIAYYDDTNNALKYAEWRCLPFPCSWYLETVADTPFEDGLGLSLKFDAQGEPHIAYYTRGQVGSLNYASHVGTGGNCGAANSWQCNEVDYGGGDAGMDPSLVLNANGLPRIAYAHYDSGKYNLWFASYSATLIQDGGCNPDSNHWSCQQISTDTSQEGRYISLAVAPDPINGLETAHIASYDITSQQLFYARNNFNETNCGENSYGVFTWACMALDYTATMEFSIIAAAADLQGYPLIAYSSFDGSRLSLNIARPIEAEGLSWGNCGPEVPVPYPHHPWQCTTLDPGVAEQIGEGFYPSVAVRPTGQAGISYWEFDDEIQAGSLKFADQRIPIFLPLVAK